MKKFNYFWFSAPATSQLLYKIALALGVVCLIIGILGANTAVNSSLFDLPVVEMLDEDGEMRNLEEDYEEILEDLEDLNRSEIREFEEEAGMEIEDLEKFFANPSISKFVKFARGVNNYDEGYFDEEELDVFRIVMLVIIIYAAIISFFALLFILCGSGGLAIFTYLISLPFHIFLTGTGFVVFSTVFFLAYAVVQIKLNREYKRYKRAARRA